MARSILYVGDAYPLLSATVTDTIGTVVDLTGYTAAFTLRQAFATSDLALGGTATILSPATSGKVQYAWAVGDLNGVAPGIYNGEWVLTAGTSKLHVDAGEFEIRKGF